MLLHHGTTRKRAEAILSGGPNPRYVEKGGQHPAEGFSTAPAQGPYGFGQPNVCAKTKDKLFPDEGGPVILEVDLPDPLANDIVGDTRNPFESGKASNFGDEINFDVGYGIERLVAVWRQLNKRILPVEPG